MTDADVPDHADAGPAGDASTTRPPETGGAFVVSEDRVLHVLGEIQRRGGIGRGSLPEAVAHAQRYVALLPAPCGELVDLGSGGGLPGLVIAVAAPGWRVHLVERRLKRADLLEYGVGALGLRGRVSVHGEDVERFAERHAGTADVVTARSFAPPLVVLRTAVPLLRRPGLVLVSDPPDGRRRWTDGDLAGLGLVDGPPMAGIRPVRTR